MAGWTCPDKDRIIWDGTIEADTGFKGDGSRLTNLPSSAGDSWASQSGAIHSSIAINTGDIDTNITSIASVSQALITSSQALTANINATSSAYQTHSADSSDPHGATLTQTTISATSVSGASITVTGDNSSSGAAYVPNIMYTEASSGIVASSYAIGTLMLVYS